MPRVQPIQNSFNAGEWSPSAKGRTDLEKYTAAASNLENFEIQPEGGIVARSGERFVQESKDSQIKGRLFPFRVSDLQSYILEFGNHYIRFFANELAVVEQTLTGIRSGGDVNILRDEFVSEAHGYATLGGPVTATTSDTLPTGLAVSTDYYILKAHTTTFASNALEVDEPNDKIVVAAGHNYSDEMGPFRLLSTLTLPPGLLGDTDYFIFFDGSDEVTTFGLSLTQSPGAKVAITGLGTGIHSLVPTNEYLRNKFRLTDVPGGNTPEPISGLGTGFMTLTPTSPDPIEIETPYSTADLPNLVTAQSADVLYIVHKGHPVKKLSRFSFQAFQFEEVLLQDGPYLPINITATTMQPSNNSGTNITVTSTTPIFVGSDVGRLLRIKNGGDPDEFWGYCKITAVGPVQFAAADIDSINFTVNANSDEGDASGNRFIAGEKVRVTSDGTLPDPLLANTDLFVFPVDSNHFTFHTTEADGLTGDNRIDLTDKGTGTPTITSSVMHVFIHGYADGDGPLSIDSTGTLPDGLTTGVEYFANVVDVSSFTLSLTSGGDAVGLSDSGVGIHTISGDTVPSLTCLADVKSNFFDTSSSGDWRLGAFGNLSSLGHPRAVTFHDQRLWFAGNPGGPQTFYASVLADFEVFTPTGVLDPDEPSLLGDLVTPTNAINYELGASDTNVIAWLSAGRTLLLGSRGENWSVQPVASTDENISPLNIKARSAGNAGALTTNPVRVDSRTVYVSKTGLKVYAVAFEFASDDHEVEELTRVARHVTQSGIVELDYANEPDSVVQAVRADGQMALLTLVRTQEIQAWSRRILGGSYVDAFDVTFDSVSDVSIANNTIAETAHGLNSGQMVRFKAGLGGTLPAGLLPNVDYWLRAVDADTLAVFTSKEDAEDDTDRIDLTDVGVGAANTFGTATHAVVESVGVIPAPLGDASSIGRTNIPHDQIWLLTKRTVNGATRRDVAFLEDTFDFMTPEPLEDAFMVDGGTYSGATATTVTGLTHLAGETVDVLADGKVHLALVVSTSGVLTVPETAVKIHYGHRYTPSFSPLRPAVQGEGITEATLGRWDHLVLRLLASLGIEFGPNTRNLTDLSDELLPHDHLMDEIPPLFTGDIEVPFEGGWETGMEMVIRQTQPLPMALLAILVEGQKGGRGNRAR